MIDVVAVDEHRHEILAAELAQRRAVGLVDLDGLHLEALVGERERDPLDVRGVLEAVEPEHRRVRRTVDRRRGRASRSASWLAEALRGALGSAASPTTPEALRLPDGTATFVREWPRARGRRAARIDPPRPRARRAQRALRARRRPSGEARARGPRLRPARSRPFRGRARLDPRRRRAARGPALRLRRSRPARPGGRRRRRAAAARAQPRRHDRRRGHHRRLGDAARARALLPGARPARLRGSGPGYWRSPGG